MNRAVLLACLLAASLFPACGRDLFKDKSGASGRRIETYYDGDSAVRTREARRRADETGFGYPTGMFPQ